MEEFLKQAREFDQSFWGGLFYFLIGVGFVAGYCLFCPMQRRLWLAILGLIIASGWTIFLFSQGHMLFGSLLVLTVLVGIARTIAIEVQRRRQRA
jgi:hypothetical protein